MSADYTDVSGCCWGTSISASVSHNGDNLGWENGGKKQTHYEGKCGEKALHSEQIC